MDVDGTTATVEEEDVPTCTFSQTLRLKHLPRSCLNATTATITGLEAPYTDPRTGLRYHDKSVYDLIKNLSPSVAKDYLSARGVNPIVK
ncbi:hypothetical protein EV363DRAFT_1323749 [Boletus edulis]|nr:hypothetical protein EV363DRAFT_1323749 [Boletus edulis]